MLSPVDILLQHTFWHHAKWMPWKYLTIMFLYTKHRQNVSLMENIRNTRKILTDHQMKEPVSEKIWIVPSLDQMTANVCILTRISWIFGKVQTKHRYNASSRSNTRKFGLFPTDPNGDKSALMGKPNFPTLVPYNACKTHAFWTDSSKFSENATQVM